MKKQLVKSPIERVARIASTPVHSIGGIEFPEVGLLFELSCKVRHRLAARVHIHESALGAARTATVHRPAKTGFHCDGGTCVNS